jgi:hypothetical protein
MKILALERDLAPNSPVPQALLEAEAHAAWSLQQAGIIRELHFRNDRPEAVLVLECDHLDHARASLAKLPLVNAGRIEFELIPLRPYPGFARLFKKPPSPESPAATT